MTSYNDSPRTGYYHLRLVQEQTPEGMVWTAQHPKLPGCHAVATGALEAVRQLDEVRIEWLGRAVEAGAKIPPPLAQPNYELVLHQEHTADDEEQAKEAVRSVAESVIFL